MRSVCWGKNKRIQIPLIMVSTSLCQHLFISNRSHQGIIVANKYIYGLWFIFILLLAGCGSKSDGPIILGDIRMGDTKEEFWKKIESDPSLYPLPGAGAFIYDKEESLGPLTALFMITERGGLMGATIIGRQIWGKEDEVLKEADKQLELLVSHFSSLYGPPDSPLTTAVLRDGNLETVDLGVNLIAGVVRGDEEDVDLLEWSGQMRSVSLSFQAREGNSFGFMVTIVSTDPDIVVRKE